MGAAVPAPTFLANQRQTPVVRHLDVGPLPEPPAIEGAVRILGVVANPPDTAPLDVAGERARVEHAVAGMVAAGAVIVDWLAPATPRRLREVLRDGSYHVLHYVGHGDFTPTGDGVLYLEDDDGTGHTELDTGELASLLADQTALRLVVLNACDGARTSLTDPFAGIATTLVQLGVPAVIAMQFAISDAAAILFAEELYTNLIGGRAPVDAAVSEARKAIFVEQGTIEWATPVLFMADTEVQLFDFVPAPVEPPPAAPAPSRRRQRRWPAARRARRARGGGGDRVGRDALAVAATTAPGPRRRPRRRHRLAARRRARDRWSLLDDAGDVRGHDPDGGGAAAPPVHGDGGSAALRVRRPRVQPEPPVRGPRAVRRARVGVRARRLRGDRSLRAVADGTYTVVVSSNGVTGPYHLTVRPIRADIDKAAVVGGPVAGTIDEPGARDVFTYDLHTGDLLYLDGVTACGPATAAKYQLYDAAGDPQLGYAVDACQDWGRVAIPSDGPYDLVVQSDLGGTGPYSIVVTGIRPDGGGGVESGGTAAGTIDTAGAVDRWTFEAPIGSTVTVAGQLGCVDGLQFDVLAPGRARPRSASPARRARLPIPSSSPAMGRTRSRSARRARRPPARPPAPTRWRSRSRRRRRRHGRRSRTNRSRFVAASSTSAAPCWTERVHCSIFPHGGRNTPPLCW